MMSVEQEFESFTGLSKDQMLDQVRKLHGELNEARINNRILWMTLGKITDQLQIPSAGIKAAVTSLLDYDIVWDKATEHEFLEVINNNIDLISNKILLITIASKLEVGELELVLEPNSIEEIISHVMDNLSDKYPECPVDISFPPVGKLIEVDFDYFSMALQLLLEIVISSDEGIKPCNISVVASGNYWHIKISGVKQKVLQVVADLPPDIVTDKISDRHMLSIDKLKLLVFGKLIKSQEIKLSIRTDQDDQILQLEVPMVNDVNP